MERWMIWGVAAGFLLGLVLVSIWSFLGPRGSKKEGFAGTAVGAEPTVEEIMKNGVGVWDEESARQACPYFKSALYSSEFALKELKEKGELDKDPQRRQQLEGFVAEYKKKCEDFGCGK